MNEAFVFGRPEHSRQDLPSTPKTQAAVLPEPGLLHVRAWRVSHSSRHRIELTSWCSTLGCVGKTRPTDLDGEQTRPTDLDGEMDTKPKDGKQADLDPETSGFRSFLVRSINARF
jgi:hypothetical protein